MRKKKIDYISDIDLKFMQWKKETPLSESQKLEIEKHARVSKLRDEKHEPSES